MLFRSNQNAGIPIAVFDISSSSVGGAHAIVYGDAGTAATLLASARFDAPLHEELDIKRFVADTVTNIESVAKKLRTVDSHVPSQLQLVLASPWYTSQTRTIVYKGEGQFLCTKKLVGDLIDAEITHIMEHELEKFGGFGKEGMVVEKQLSLIRLNGYATSDPFGKRARMLELYLTITIAPKQVVDMFTDALKRVYGTKRIHATTSTYATFVAARDYFNAGKDCVIIDVGEEVTDVAFVKDGRFLYQHSFPVGSYGLYRAIMDEGKHTAVEAEALLETYRLGKVGIRIKGRIDKAVRTFSEEWRKGLQGILDDGHYGFCLPDRCYITADPRFAGVYPAIITTDPFIQHACSEGVVHAVFIGSDELAPHIHALDEIVDVPLATATLYGGRVL